MVRQSLERQKEVGARGLQSASVRKCEVTNPSSVKDLYSFKKLSNVIIGERCENKPFAGEDHGKDPRQISGGETRYSQLIRFEAVKGMRTNSSKRATGGHIDPESHSYKPHKLFRGGLKGGVLEEVYIIKVT